MVVDTSAILMIIAMMMVAIDEFLQQRLSVRYLRGFRTA